MKLNKEQIEKRMESIKFMLDGFNPQCLIDDYNEKLKELEQMKRDLTIDDILN